MSTQLLSLAGFPENSTGKRKTLRRTSSQKESSTNFISGHHLYAYREMSGSEHLGDDKGRKGRKKMKRREKSQSGAAREVPFLNFWYFASTIGHFLRRAKAFYNECCCDAYEECRRMGKVEVTLVDPYFSVPAFPCTSMAN